MYEACGFGEPALDLLKDIDHICHWRVWLSQSHLRTFQPLLMGVISALPCGRGVMEPVPASLPETTVTVSVSWSLSPWKPEVVYTGGMGTCDTPRLLG